MLIDGSPANISPDDLQAYCSLVERIRPLEVHAYSIDRPVAAAQIELVPPQRLEAIARQIFAATAVPVKIFSPRQPQGARNAGHQTPIAVVKFRYMCKFVISSSMR